MSKLTTSDPWWKCKILHRIPGLFKRCPEGNYHWFWDRYCSCTCLGEHAMRYEYQIMKAETLINEEQLDEFGGKGWDLIEIVQWGHDFYFYFRRTI